MNEKVKIRFEHVRETNGHTVLFLMGLSMDGFGWSNQFLNQFIQEGFGVIRMDNRCTGGSTFVKNVSSSKFSLSDMARDAVAVLDTAKVNQVHVVGVSLGGMIAQQMTIDFPERVLSITSIMSGAHLHPFNLSLRSYSTFLQLGWNAAKPRSEGKRERYKAINTDIWKTLDPKGIDETDYEWIDKVSEYQLKHGNQIRPDSAVHQLLAVLRGGSRFKQLEQSKVPKLIIHGDADPLIQPKHSIEFAERIPNSKLIVLQDMGHTLPRRYYGRIYRDIRNMISA